MHIRGEALISAEPALRDLMAMSFHVRRSPWLAPSRSRSPLSSIQDVLSLMEPLLCPIERHLPIGRSPPRIRPPSRPTWCSSGPDDTALRCSTGFAARPPLGFNPGVVAQWQGKAADVRFGDANDPDSWLRCRWTAALVVCATPPHLGSLAHAEVRQSLLHALRARGYEGRMAFRPTAPRSPAHARPGRECRATAVRGRLGPSGRTAARGDYFGETGAAR